MRKLPVSIVSGFLGSGKTTLLNHVLTSDHGLKIAVIVNDMGEVNIDAAFIASGGDYTESRENLVEMTNGCICCTLRGDLLLELHRLSLLGVYDHVLIESTGIAEPLPIAVTFDMPLSDGSYLRDHCVIDTMLTVVDCTTFMSHLKSRDQDSGKSLSRLLLDQVEFANTLVLSKVDLVSSEDRSSIMSLLSTLNPTAHIVDCLFGVIDLSLVFGRNDFSFDDARKNSMWHDELLNPHESEVDEYNIKSFVFRSSRPLSSSSLLSVLRRQWPGVLRSKGRLSVADGEGLQYYFSLAGHERTLSARGLSSDGVSELVFIGQNMDNVLIEGWFRDCEASESLPDDVLLRSMS